MPQCSWEITHKGRKNTLNSRAIEGYKQTLSDVILPENTQKVESLLCFLHQFNGVPAPSQVHFNTDSQETEVCEPFHTDPTNDYRLDNRFFVS